MSLSFADTKLQSHFFSNECRTHDREYIFVVKLINLICLATKVYENKLFLVLWQLSLFRSKMNVTLRA